MADGSEYIELKFRIYDGTDICHCSYVSSSTILSLKQKLVSEWPQGKSMVPKTSNDIKLIHLGKVLENNKTLSESGVRDGAFAGGVITMHVVIQPVIAKKNSAKKQDDTGKLNSCGCTIL
uniref:membrane-anchored ubiquitin-fold protein 3-like n=1 Tax=Erigeron canadensis TaxID=72917 RepID=UPI001CB8D65F|nr:membrane-anchored ubiquitin-fold protein 3-like [Erigeron canadensis]